MARKRRRRIWDDEEKRRIVAQTRVPGVSVSQVARRYDVNANMVFKWLRDPRFKPPEDDLPPFLPSRFCRTHHLGRLWRLALPSPIGVALERNVGCWHKTEVQRPPWLGRPTAALPTLGLECQFIASIQT